MKNWMSNLSNSKKLININIPGTHDSGTHGTVVPFAKTQSWSVERQLNNGIRFLDIRLSKSAKIPGVSEFLLANIFILKHGVAPVGGTFVDAVLVPVYEFLRKNPQETVLMSIKSEESTFKITSDDMKEFAALSYFYDHKKDIKNVELGDVRGKIVLLNRVTDDHGYAWANFKKQDVYELEMKHYEQIIVPEVKERTQRVCMPFTDICYEQVIIIGVKERTKRMPCGWDYAKKTENISKFLKDNKDNVENKLNINFLTASSSDFVNYFAFTNGVEMNAIIQNEFIAKKNWYANGMVFPMDFPTPEAIEKIVSSNF
ncbi:phosphatidylinositol-specific phospholipase C domain-containing protein [Kordia sp.]|uniref:phosphatidylinositol-specific phospholipase C domain-containing protein n=1 Tax=Kordia sp. TaxID=1965332 RepID=UPI003B598491